MLCVIEKSASDIAQYLVCIGNLGIVEYLYYSFLGRKFNLDNVAKNFLQFSLLKLYLSAQIRY